MGIFGFYLRKLYTIIKGEVLVLPSRIVVFLFFLVLLLLPVITQDPYLLRILILTSIFAILAASWDLLSGFTGQMNFGHALFFGVGAYGAALLNLHVHIPPWGSIPLGALAAVLAGLIIGIPCLRLKGTYLALTTLAFPIILMGVVFAIPDITGGEMGVSGLDRLSGSRLHDYDCSLKSLSRVSSFQRGILFFKSFKTFFECLFRSGLNIGIDGGKDRVIHAGEYCRRVEFIELGCDIIHEIGGPFPV